MSAHPADISLIYTHVYSYVEPPLLLRACRNVPNFLNKVNFPKCHDLPKYPCYFVVCTLLLLKMSPTGRACTVASSVSRSLCTHGFCRLTADGDACTVNNLCFPFCYSSSAFYQRCAVVWQLQPRICRNLTRGTTHTKKKKKAPPPPASDKCSFPVWNDGNVGLAAGEPSLSEDCKTHRGTGVRKHGRKWGSMFL